MTERSSTAATHPVMYVLGIGGDNGILGVAVECAGVERNTYSEGSHLGIYRR